MEQKSKFILFGLAGAVLLLLVLFLNANNSRQAAVNERDAALQERQAAENKLSRLQGSIQEYENKIRSLNSELNNVSRAKDELQEKYEIANRTREELIQKLKEKPAPAAASGPSFAARDTTAGQEAYWGKILETKSNLEMQLEKVRSELKSTQISNEELQRQKAALDLEMRSIKREKDDVQRQLEYNQKLMEKVSQELVVERSDRIKVQEAFKVVRNENAALSRNIELLGLRKVELEKKTQELKDDRLALSHKVNNLEIMLTDNIQQITDLKDQLEGIRSGRPATAGKEGKSSVELPPIVVRPSPAMQSSVSSPAIEPAKIPGKVIGINKENNFVVIDLGVSAGIRAGDKFNVFRDGEKIAGIEVIKVSKTVTACDIKKEYKPIKIGDQVR